MFVWSCASARVLHCSNSEMKPPFTIVNSVLCAGKLQLLQACQISFVHGVDVTANYIAAVADPVTFPRARASLVPTSQYS